ncbi:hypothetical protein N431DRAFT_474588 [Stipitochalara longipes BDJ]|nr:hypothetical protein N431DRAFT_474588 [Stipitochalara longipes BDJ]
MSDTDGPGSLAVVVRANRRTAVAPSPMTGPPLSELLGNKIVRIKLDNPVAFGLFVGWVYKGVVELPEDGEGSCVTDEIQLFGLAEKHDIAELADKTMDHLVVRLKFGNLMLVPGAISFAYKVTHEASKLRRFSAQCAVYAVLNFPTDHGNDTWFKANIQMAITECNYLGEDALETLRLHSGKAFEDPRESLLCDYHQYAEAEYCPYESQ